MVDLSTLGSGTLGVWTGAQARRLLTQGEVDARVRAGTWQVLWRGVYADGGYAPTVEQRAVAAVLATGGGPPAQGLAGRYRLRSVAAGRTAARVLALPLVDERSGHLLDEVAVDRQLPPQRYGGRRLVPHLRALPRERLLHRPGGLWLTSPLQTVLDCARDLEHEALVCLLDAALHAHAVTVDELTTALVPGLRGAPALRRALALADARAESPAETVARLVLQPVLPTLEPQVPLVDAAGRVLARFDLADRRVRLAVEVDGQAAHAGMVMVAKDRRRDRTAEGLGWHTERVTWAELRSERSQVVRRIAARHAELAARAAA